MNKKNIIGIGSAGLTALNFLNKKNLLSPNCLLFIRREFENKLVENKENTITTREKFDALSLLKQTAFVSYLTDGSLSKKDKHFGASIRMRKIVVIVGLGGRSGDFLISLYMSSFFNQKDLVIFCFTPFQFEGTKRMNIAKFQLERMSKTKGTLFHLENQKLINACNKRFDDAFHSYYNFIAKELTSEAL